MNYTGKKVLIVGMAKSGVSAAKLLYQMGAQIALYDRKSREDFAKHKEIMALLDRVKNGRKY